MLSLDIVIERFIFTLGDKGETKGIVIAESRDPTLDNQLELAFLNLKIQGTFYIPAYKIKKTVETFSIRDKNEDIAGLQIADLVVSPIGRHILGKETHQDFETIRGKFRKRGQTYEGYGLVVLPK